MKNLIKGILLFALAVSIAVPTAVLSAEISGKELAQKVFDRNRGQSSVSKAQMILVDKNENKRKRHFTSKRVLADGLERQLIRFTSPADIEGTGFLTIEKQGYETEQFLFLPALRRSRRIVTSQKSHRFVNSDFTYEDMERHPVDDYVYAITGSRKIGSIDCYVLETRPKENVESQYALTVSMIAKESFVPVFVRYFDKSETHIKTYKVLKLDTVQNIWTELMVSMEDRERNHKTYIKTDNISYNTGLKPDDISKKTLENY